MNELALFAGAGGGILGGKLLGRRTVCAVELDAAARGVLLARQRDGYLPAFPIWDDVRTFDGRPWRGAIDVVCAGFPCQDISIVGPGAGLDGERSGLWRDTARIIREVGPEWVELENSPMLTSRGLGDVLRDLANMGFDARWGVLGASATGLDHARDRCWIVAHAHRFGRERQCPARDGAAQSAAVLARSQAPGGTHPARVAAWRAAQPGVQRVVDGVARAMDRHRAIGNGQVPRVVATAWRTLTADTLALKRAKEPR